MDHRAIKQADRINATGHKVLDYVGGVISPEMETPKLLWLKERQPETYAGAWQFFDLADYLTWRATGSLARSVCTLTCKWTYLAHENRWDPSYFDAIGLGDLAAENFARIGTEVVPGGTALSVGLTAQAASDFGLPGGVAVGAGAVLWAWKGTGPLVTAGVTEAAASVIMAKKMARTRSENRPTASDSSSDNASAPPTPAASAAHVEPRRVVAMAMP